MEAHLPRFSVKRVARTERSPFVSYVSRSLSRYLLHSRARVCAARACVNVHADADTRAGRGDLQTRDR